MQHERRDLEQLFDPPPGKFGTHMLICGLSADTETLERITSTFTGESPVERAASGLLRAALMLDASAPQLGRLDVPGMLQLAHCPRERWTAQTTLMHAKVALLGFSDARFAAPTSFRLVVSTGNWTRETWGNSTQIDLFWSTECSMDAVATDPQAFADASASLAFFDRLMASLYPRSSAFLIRQPLAMGWLNRWRTLLAPGTVDAEPHFIHSLDESLLAQIEEVFPVEGVSIMVVGSGFWERPMHGAAEKPEILRRLDQLTVRGERYLVANPSQAGALAQWVLANPNRKRNARIGGWTFCMPLDPLQTDKKPVRTFLHAKYIAGLTRVALANAKGTMTFLYLGSGNLSRAGLLSSAALDDAKARRRAGNVEAGILMTGRQEVTRVWHALACGDILSHDLVQSMEAGIRDPILVPHDPPPVLFAQVAGARLILIRSTDATTGLEVRLDAVGPWLGVNAGNDGLPFTGQVPPMIWVRLPPAATGNTPEVFEVPVVAEDGVCCRQAPNELNLDDVLDALLVFPSPPSGLPDPNPLPQPATSDASRPAETSRYPLKLMAELIETIGQRNATLTKEQFPVWLSQLRYLLLEQVSDAERETVRATGVNLFPALLLPGFAPCWLRETTHLDARYRHFVRDIEALWTRPSASACPAPPGLPSEGDALD